MTSIEDISGKGNRIRFNFFNGFSLFLISASVISLQILLMRSLAITRYHHFSYLVISTALLGFGVSGTFLSLFSDYLKRHYTLWSCVFIFMFAFSIPICYIMAERLPIDIQYVFYSSRQILLMVVYNVILFIPFFLGAVVIGLALVYFRENIPVVYGINLLGSGAGGVLAIAAMFYIPAVRLPVAVSVVAFLSLFFWALSSKIYFEKRYILITVFVLFLGMVFSALFIYYKPFVNIDQYKMIAHLERLEKQSDAERLITTFSPRGQIDVYDSNRLHHTMFAGLGSDVMPPPQLAVLVDGEYAGTIFKINSKEEARILDFTPQSLPYRLIDSPSVLLLGEIGGANVWLAKRYGAEKIIVVQGNPLLNKILMDELAGVSGGIYNSPGVEIINKEPYLFIEQTEERFDIIHIVSAEGMSAGVSGLRSLHEDYLLTVESIAKSYQRLSDRGLIAITRGLQSLPRDNIKIFSLFASALEHAGIKNIKRHLLQSRNYLSANTMISKEPISYNLIKRYREITHNLLMDIDYYPGIKSEDIQQINVVDGPADRRYSYFHFGAIKILSNERDRFFDEWVYSVNPPTDDRPFFYDFFKWRSVGRFFESYGRQWLQRLELGYVVLIFTFLEVAVTALIFIFIPLFWSKIRVKGEGGKLPTAIYFLCLGFGFMFIEMVFILKFTRFMGNPIYSVSVALTSVLVFAGLGSLYQQKAGLQLIRRIRFAVLGIFSVSIFYLIFLDSILALFISSNVAIRFIITTLLLSPLSFFMGWMFPLGLKILEKRSINLIPWAWGVNGFASVSAAPLSIMLSMSYGFSGVVVIAVIFYLSAGATAGLLGKNHIFSN